MCLCNIFMASGGGPEYIWGGVLDGFGKSIWKVFGWYFEGFGGYPDIQIGRGRFIGRSGVRDAQIDTQDMFTWTHKRCLN